MGLSDEGDENVLARFEELCLDLNMDKKAKDEAWKSYEKIRTNYTLEVRNWQLTAILVGDSRYFNIYFRESYVIFNHLTFEIRSALSDSSSRLFMLQGDQIHWLSCALYEACRRSVVPTVGRGTVEGNCVSLTRLLRSAKFR